MASSSSTPASSPQKWIYDVFLSFRGQDTRKTFIDHLYSALKEKGIYTYKDDETLQRGESIAPSLLKAIRESRITAVVFSENYADSSWCLDELEYIMKCMDEIGQIVLPIFYHVEPSQVREQKGEFGKGFAKHESAGNNNKVESWRNALVAAANLSGWETMHIANGHEARCINEIVNTISERLPSIISNVDEEFIGLSTRIQQLKSELEIGSGGVRMVGIWGLGGGGKTTLASCVYDEISSMFDKCCFLENIRENSIRNGLKSLQQRILKEVGVGRVEKGRHEIKRRLSHTSVLIVLDDVDDLAQLDALAGSHDWFGEGSRILITTRDNHVLKAHRVDVIHNICLLNDDEAFKLFRKHAPQGKLHIEDYEHFSKKVVHYASGLPLALKVLGCFLCDKDMNEWKSALARLKQIPDNNIVEILKISFDGLTTVEKDLFLDIACLYRGDHIANTMPMLEACGFHPVIGVKVLIQKALITINSYGMFNMHDLVQEMGHYIVRGKHSNNPLKHSRVWEVDDVKRILATDTKMELDKIEAIRYFKNDTLPSHADASMTNLRSVDLHRLCGSSLPAYLLTRELRCLNLNGCRHRQLWEGYKFLPNLRYINICVMGFLITTPDVTGLPNLERFEIRSSAILEEIHSSIGRSESLVYLRITSCINLVVVPPITRSKKLETLLIKNNPKLFKLSEIPEIHVDEIGREEVTSDKHCCTNRFVRYLRCCCSNLGEPDKAEFDVQFSSGAPSLPRNISYISSNKRLTNLILSCCNLGDDDFGSVVGELPNLQKLDLSENNFSRIDFSLLKLPRLKYLRVTSCLNLVELLDLPSSIAVLEADSCHLLESIGDISNCKWLWKVSLVDSVVFKIPDFISEGNAIEDYFISLSFLTNQLQMEFVDRVVTGGKIFTLQLPPNWYDDSCGFFICIYSNANIYSEEKMLYFTIILKPEMGKDFQFEDGQESYVAQTPDSYSHTYVGYVSFKMLKRHTQAPWWNSAYNITSFSILVDDGATFGAKLVLRKSKGPAVQTAKTASDYSEFWDENYEDRKTFTIQHDSNSSIKIVWTPCG